MDAESENMRNSICFVTGHNQSDLLKILEAVQKLQICNQDLSDDGDIVYLGRQDRCNDGMPVKTPSHLLVELYRRLKLARSGCKTILSAESQLVVVQLCLAEYSKQTYDIYDTDASEVLHTLREITKHKLSPHDANPSNEESNRMSDNPASEAVRKLYEAFLSSCNMVDMADVFCQVKSILERDEDAFKSFRARKKLIVLQWPDEPFERKVLTLLCGQTMVTEVKVEMLPASLGNNEDGFKLHVQERDWETVQDINDNNRCAVSSSPKTPRSPVSSTEVLVRQIFLSFLGLLINSRDEISLARCLSYSPSGLDHRGFTALKNFAKTKNISMYQMAVSYITRLRLHGSRSNVPSTEYSSLSDHVKSLSEFVTNVQQLQMLVEETPDARQSITKVLVSIKGILCKCKGSVLKPEAVEKVCGKLRSELEALLTTSFDRRNESSPPKAVNQGGSLWGQKTLKLILMFLDEEATRPASYNVISVLSDCMLTQSTPVRMPSLLDQFRSPKIVDPKLPENQGLRARVITPTEEVKKPKMFDYKSDMAWAEPTHRNPLQEQNPNINHNAPSQPDNQPIKLWAETPPGKHCQARTFVHEFDSQTGGMHLSCDIIDHTPKRPNGRVRKITAAALDKENIVLNQGTREGVKMKGVKTKGVESKKKEVAVKKRVKRVLEDTGSSQPSKKIKKGGVGGQKKKQVALAKGQKTLNQFFRL